MKTESPSHSKLVKARIQLLFSHPFFASLCLRLQFISRAIPTMSTDGRAIYYGEKFVESLTPAELEGVLAHEAFHCALGHHCRRGTRTSDRWNEACDYAINPIILQNGLVLPADALIKKEFEGLSAEEIYARLAPEPSHGGGGQKPQPDGASGGSRPEASPQVPVADSQAGGAKKPPGPKAAGRRKPESAPQQKPSNSQPDSSQSQTPNPDRTQQVSSQMPNPTPPPQVQPRPGAIGEVMDAVDDDGDPASVAETTEQEQHWAVAAEQAAQLAKSCGNAPLGIDRLLEEARESKKDWRSILREFVAATTPSDYRFCPPNRRYIHAGLYLPSIHREGTGRIVVAVDTSGSIGKEELKQFAGEISAISEEAQPEAIHVVYCDTAVQSTQEFAPSEPIELEPKGHGGTNFRPVFEWVERNDVRPVCLIYLTDLACDKYPATSPDYPVLWVTDSRRIAPFGETLKIVAD